MHPWAISQLPSRGRWISILLPHQDPAREIRRVMDFLEVELPPEVLERIVQQTSFQIMKENPMANYSSIPRVILDQTISPFMRKGERRGRGTWGLWGPLTPLALSGKFPIHCSVALRNGASGTCARYSG